MMVNNARGRHNRRRKLTSFNRAGAALLLALITVVMTVTIVIAITWRVGFFSDSVGIESERARMERLVAYTLQNILEELLSDGKTLLTGSETKRITIDSPDPYVSITAVCQDAQAGINVNNVVLSEKYKREHARNLERLMTLVDVSSAISDNILDYIDADDEPRSNGVETKHYLGLSPPYRAANRPLLIIAELAKVHGIEQNILEILRPHLVTLPDEAKLNVNTASAKALTATISGLTLPQAESLVESRNRFAFSDLDDFFRRARSGDSTENREFLTVRGRYHNVDIFISFAQATLRLKALIDTGSTERPGGVIFLSWS